MSFIKSDWKHELDQVEATLGRCVTNNLKPAIDDSVLQASSRLQETVKKAGDELRSVVQEAGDKLDENIRQLSHEIHNQRSMTKEDIKALVDYATDKIGLVMDQRITQLKDETSALINDKVVLLKAELEDATIKSRKMLYTNLAISCSAALSMAVIGFIYKKITIGQLDPFVLFRIFLFSCAIGAGLMGALKIYQDWRAKSAIKKGVASTVFNFVGVFRPNGALGLFVLSLLFISVWAWLTLHS